MHVVHAGADPSPCTFYFTNTLRELCKVFIRVPSHRLPLRFLFDLTKQGMSTAEGSRASGREGAPLVSEAERTYFVEAVLAGEFTPTLTAVAYHFSGWLDGGG